MWSGRLVAFVDYEEASTGRGENVLLRVDDMYLQYNRAKAFNSETRKHRDKVVIVQGEATVSVPSVFLSALGERQSFSRNGTTFEMCSFVLGGPADYVDMRIYPTGIVSQCPTATLREAPTPTPTTPPPQPTARTVRPNDHCVGAEAVSIGNHSGTTIEATSDDHEADSCVLYSSPGVWYTVVGTGGDLNVSTCGNETKFDTLMAVFEGNCGNLTCVAWNDDSCGFGSSITWPTQVGVEYKVLVYGWTTIAGTFRLSVELRSDSSSFATAHTPQEDGLAQMTVEQEPCEDGPGLFRVDDHFEQQGCAWALFPTSMD